MGSYSQKTILGIPITALTLADIPRVVVSLIESSGKKTFFYVNAHCLNLANRDQEYKKILQRASLVYSGGIGPILASKILGRPLAERTPTPDFIFDVFVIAQQKKWSVYFLGTTNNSLQKAVNKLQKRFPKLKIVGYHSGFFDAEEEGKIIREINLKKPTMVIVGMGTPRQEKWIANHKDKLNTKVLWVVGALFDVISGQLPRAPIFWQRLGLEWAYRLYQEPTRLWERYTFGNLEFILRVAKEYLVLK